MRTITPPLTLGDIRLSSALTYDEIRRNAKESELDALTDMRATNAFCDLREELVKTWPAGYSGNYSAFKKGTLEGIQEYRDVYMAENMERGRR